MRENGAEVSNRNLALLWLNYEPFCIVLIIKYFYFYYTI